VVTETFNTSIEFYLTRGILVMLCAEIESTVTKLILDRVASSSDPEIGAFAQSVGPGFVRNAKTGEIGRILARFGEDCHARYDAALKATIEDAGIARIGNVVFTRGQFAHSEPPAVTFREAEDAHLDAVKMIDAVATALGLPTSP